MSIKYEGTVSTAASLDSEITIHAEHLPLSNFVERGIVRIVSKAPDKVEYVVAISNG